MDVSRRWCVLAPPISFLVHPPTLPVAPIPNVFPGIRHCCSVPVLLEWRMLDPRSSVPPPISPAACPAYVDVVLPRRLHRPFSYVIPTELKGKILVGQSVIVPFGSQLLHGLVIAVHSRLPSGAPGRGLKAIRSLADASAEESLTSSQVDLSRWVADRYAAPWGQCIKLVLPPVGHTGRIQPRYFPTKQGLTCLSSLEEEGEVESQLLKRLSRRRNGLSAATLAQPDKSPVTRALQALIRKGLVFRRDEAVIPRVSRAKKDMTKRVRPALPEKLALDLDTCPPAGAASWQTTVGQAVSQGTFVSLLLQTSRDTRWWYLVKAALDTIRRGRRVLIITGDVENASRLAESLANAGERPTLLHSGLSARDRAAAWLSVQDPEARILVGTRLAAFAPIETLGLVWVDGEDDASLKEEQVPRYHAREVARRRAVCDRALLVLASSHPSLESWSAAQQGEMILCVYRDPAATPEVQVIDRKHSARGYMADTLLSPPLCDGIRKSLQQNALSILYLNRKGFASVLHCRDCGAMPQCDGCRVSLTFYKRNNHMRCHYCGRTQPVPDHCRQCQSLKLEPVGSGTERIEEAVRRIFPQARVGRVDGETIRHSADVRAFKRLLAAGDIDIVIGTQMLFRLGLHSQAAFVAVPDADAGLHVPDFRSAERMYHGLVDAVELARPAHSGGVVIVQTRFMDHHAIKAIAHGDDSLFFEQEQAFRQMLRYPPCTHLLKLDVSGTLEPVVAEAADRWKALLHAQVAGSEGQESKEDRRPVVTQRFAGVSGDAKKIVILGPSPAPHAMARGRYCWQILIKAVSLEMGTEMVVQTLEILERGPRRGGLRFDIDVDPVAMG